MPKPKSEPHKFPTVNVFDELLCEDTLAREVFLTLSPRELEVFAKLVRGKLTKKIAFEMGVSCRTVDAYRYEIMRKLKLSTIAEEAVLGWRIRKFITAYLVTRSHLCVDHVDIPWDNSRTFEPVA